MVAPILAALPSLVSTASTIWSIATNARELFGQNKAISLPSFTKKSEKIRPHRSRSYSSSRQSRSRSHSRRSRSRSHSRRSRSHSPSRQSRRRTRRSRSRDRRSRSHSRQMNRAQSRTREAGEARNALAALGVEDQTARYQRIWRWVDSSKPNHVSGNNYDPPPSYHSPKRQTPYPVMGPSAPASTPSPTLLQESSHVNNAASVSSRPAKPKSSKKGLSFPKLPKFRLRNNSSSKKSVSSEHPRVSTRSVVDENQKSVGSSINESEYDQLENYSNKPLTTQQAPPQVEHYYSGVNQQLTVAKANIPKTKKIVQIKEESDDENPHYQRYIKLYSSFAQSPVTVPSPDYLIRTGVIVDRQESKARRLIKWAAWYAKAGLRKLKCRFETTLTEAGHRKYYSEVELYASILTCIFRSEKIRKLELAHFVYALAYKVRDINLISLSFGDIMSYIEQQEMQDTLTQIRENPPSNLELNKANDFQNVWNMVQRR